MICDSEIYAYEPFLSTSPLCLAEPDWDVDSVSIPISLDSEDVLNYIDRPCETRRIVEYDESLLTFYRPGETWYLPASVRRELRNMGDTGQSGFPAGTYGRQILNRLLIDLSWASSNLEGNTYTWRDTRELIEYGIASRSKSSNEAQMILNHKRVIEMLVAASGIFSFDKATAFAMHALLSERLLSEEEDEGRVRKHAAGIGESVYQPLTIPAKIEGLFEVMLEKVRQIPDPFEQSFFIMVHLPYLQPFADANKRTSRLLSNLPLIRANLCPLAFIGVPKKAYYRATLGVYEMSRIELLRDLYVWAYRRSTQEYLIVKRDVVDPDRLGLVHRELINEIVHQVVVRLEDNPLNWIRMRLSEQVDEPDRASVEALITGRLKCMHEGMLYRFKLTLEQLSKWQARQHFL